MTRRTPIRVRRHQSLAAFAVVAIGLLVVTPAGAAPRDDPAAKRQEVQRQRAQAASKVDVLKASEDELGDALDALQRNIRGQQARADGARQAAAAATSQAERARAAETGTAAALAERREALRAVAVDAYIKGPAQGLALAVGAASLNELSTRQYFVELTANRGADAADELRRAREDLEVQRVAADEAQARAVARQKAADRRLRDLKASEEAQERVAAQVEARLEATLAEVAALEVVDQRLASEIAARQRRLASQLAARRTPSAPRATRSAPRSSGSVSTTTVGGITVATSLAGDLQRLLDAASAEGISFGGGGYRSSDGQVATRRANCGTSDYDIYEKPASSCSPPTARPGQSMHEQGLAIDFTVGGRLVESRGQPGFQWLARNASRFGFSNLPREPWHWSTNGN